MRRLFLAILFLAQSASADTATFTDVDLHKLETSHKAVMLYIWSQDQIYSMKYWRWYQEAAIKQKMDFVAISKLPISKHPDFQVYSMPANLFSLRNDSPRIDAMGATMHAPSILIIENGKVIPRAIIGLLHPADLNSAIKKTRKLQ